MTESTRLHGLTIKGLYVLSGEALEFGSITQFDKDRFVVKLGEETALEIGSTVSIRLITSDARKTAPLQARVTARNEESYARVYHLAPCPESIEALEPEVRALFDRRGVRRTRPRTHVPVQVGLPATGTSVTGVLQDISGRGAGVVVKSTDDKYFVSATTVQVTFRLTDGPPYAFMGSIRRRLLGKQGILYGIEFDVEMTPRGAQNAERLEQAIGH